MPMNKKGKARKAKKASVKKTGLIALAAAALASPVSAATPVISENPSSFSPHETGKASAQVDKKNLLAQAPVDKPEIIVEPNKPDGGMQQPAGEPAQSPPAQTQTDDGAAQSSPQSDQAPSQPVDPPR